MIKIVKKFLEPYLSDAPLLLALSGGPDSMALYYILKEIGINFECAHVDHGWRESSRLEAEWLKSCVPNLHVLTLAKSDFKGNLEDAGRRLRIEFLKECAKKIGAKAILMAHHADDQAETVMKRLFEKVPPYSLKGIAAVSDLDGFQLLRPLLPFTKDEILAYLGDRPFILDPSNVEGPFLRAKMRRDLIPFLNESFGKNCSDTFNRFQSDVGELQSYLNRQIEGKYKKITGPFGACLFLEGDPYELKVMICRFLKEECIEINYAIVNLIVENRCKSNIRFNDLYLDRNVLFTCNSIPAFKDTIKLSNQIQKAGEWHVQIDDKAPSCGWESFWGGEVSILGEGDLWIAPPDQKTLKNRQDKKIAQFLRVSCPVVYNEKGEIFDFLAPIKKNPISPLRILLKFTTLC